MVVYRRIANFILFGLLTVVVSLGGHTAAIAAEGEVQEELNIQDGTLEKKDNLLNLFFGSIPMMSTQRGTVIIEAYHDINGNQRRDAGEERLNKVVSCIVDEVEYTLPAFIPGLDNGKNYTILFEGTRFQPTVGKKNVFIKKRGQIIRIDLPCREGTPITSLASKAEKTSP